jgi:hypothetical protein
LEELGCSLGFIRSQSLHLPEDFEELLWWEGVDGSGDGVGAGDTRSELFTRRKRWDCPG